MPERYAHIIEKFYGTPWAIMPEKLSAMSDLIMIRAAGIKLSAEEIQANIGAAHKPAQSMSGSVAVIPVYGVISQRMDMMSEISGGTSAEKLSKQIRAAIDDDSVGSILLDIDSPGGSVYGITELADVIFKARESKRIVAVANSLAASAAYWIATAASEFVITPGGEAGSIGVLTAHTDVSQFEEKIGKKTTMISAGKYKVEGNPYEALSEEAREAIQTRINEYYGMFVNAVAKYRGVSASDVRNGFAEGRVVGAKEAVALGMADKVATFDATLARMTGSRSSSSSSSRSRRAAADRKLALANTD